MMPVDGLASAAFMGLVMIALGLCGTICATLRIPARWRLWLKKSNPVKVNRKKDGTINSQWKSKPATMIRKVALVQALREAFPEDYQGLYVQEEMDVADIPLPEAPVNPETPVLPADEAAEPPDVRTDEQDPLA